jgi:hypothetical protein
VGDGTVFELEIHADRLAWHEPGRSPSLRMSRIDHDAVLER